MGLPDFDLYIFGIRSSWGFQNGMSLACPVLFLNLTCGADVNQNAMPGLLFPTKSKQIDLNIAKMFRRLAANTVPFHLGTKGQHILDVPLMIQPMAKPGARLQLIQMEKSLMENGETVKMDVMFVRRCKIKIAFSHSNTKERSILSVLPMVQRMEKLGVQQK